MRIGGLATGIDTESIIRDMMNANRMPLNKITQKKQFTEWQIDKYRSNNLELKKFSDNIFSNMILSDTFRQKTVDVSNPDAVGVKNNSSTGDFSGTIAIGRLAKAATMQGKEIIPPVGKSVALTSKLEDLGFVTGDVEKSIIIKTTGADGVSVEGAPLKFKSTDTLQTVLNKINENPDVTAFFDPGSGRIGMTANNGVKMIEVSGDTDDANNLSNALGLETADFNEGHDAIFNFNGMEMTRSTNKFEINGFEFTLKATTTTLKDGVTDVNAGTSVTFSSAADTDKILDNIVKFVDEYNTLIETLNAQIKEPKYRDFHPLSAEQKADMKEKEIELWEEKAMSGLLKNDPMISSMLSKMRTALMGSIGGDGEKTLKSIGITPSTNYMDNGKLIIDEEALRAAIADDPDKVHQLFSAGTAESAEKDQGFARKLRSIAQATENQIKERAGAASSTNATFTIGRSLTEMDKQITRFEDRLRMTEDRLWKQFTAMEVAIQKANAQSASLMNSFGGGM